MSQCPDSFPRLASRIQGSGHGHGHGHEHGHGHVQCAVSQWRVKERSSLFSVLGRRLSVFCWWLCLLQKSDTLAPLVIVQMHWSKRCHSSECRCLCCSYRCRRRAAQLHISPDRRTDLRRGSRHKSHTRL